VPKKEREREGDWGMGRLGERETGRRGERVMGRKGVAKGDVKD
jgi:hypothetical protein